ncbi:L-alanine-DL-glutamate epimerase-like enolase superfamily enzyme [Dysgonomonas sp. PFB1-18]|uniref:dipeptide epimerase n=1 Tax=unclassified Dysgonomonas TaxID=2630389 RepID=UPI00247445BB|nr:MULTISPECIES: dipeptide epimerase [unclassified Dysgonomonas]MDH6308727.1 L-alanine-DL-glutamate epimerase-like enolase superfamily enzyme [Dysgonomonas sp. PF1-14]MDH6338576.1 L-alanine-DL-glutamate epimerase-like enolase superfamily enzyme [Dysgonomonas sp. PF1-16]MDH6379976.1 L-alanine-DL-glutamate epimerase-like enolase superfamily enzyme [Dysgonomonas sp. PFB1-18]MDH6397404.1 L-alanine-DL-glutamate epimerase-like enolase superfamily enzyme [Dysgonomonas sp. PF1-23]
MRSNRRNFIKTATLATLATGISASPLNIFAQNNKKVISLNKKMTLTFKPYDLQLRHVFTLANSSRKTTPVVLTEIVYDGITGYGEASLPPYLGETQASVMEFLKKVNLEQFSSPFELEDILTYVDKIADNNTAAKASVDIALHDLVGKLMNQPWYKIWGLNKADTPDTTFTIGIDTDEVVKQKTKEAAPYNILKVKLGRDTDKQMIEAIRSVTDKPIAVDANQGWKDKHYALDMIYWLKEKGVVMLEQPLSKYNLEDAAWITERSPIPVFADESFQRLPDILRIKGAFSGINIKLMKCTGMREAWKMITIARAANMNVMIGCMTETSCAISAATQLSSGVDWADLDGNLLISNDCFKGVTVTNGRMTLNDLPGIGIERLK